MIFENGWKIFESFKKFKKKLSFQRNLLLKVRNFHENYDAKKRLKF